MNHCGFCKRKDCSGLYGECPEIVCPCGDPYCKGNCGEIESDYGA